jgi:AraC-like DNA-binding protein
MMTAPVAHLREKRASIRILWPFLRIIGPTAAAVEVLAREGIGARELARPDTRLRHRVVMELLEACIAWSGDPAIGLRAGQCVEPGDLETMEYAARSCSTLREAIQCSARHFHLLNEAAEVSLLEYKDRALWRFGVNDGVPQSRASNDFVIACAAKFARRYARIDEPPMEIHFMHPCPSDTQAYDKFRSKLTFRMPHNGFVIARSMLDRPMLPAHATMREAFEMYACEQSQKLLFGVRGRTREIIGAQLPSGEMSMESVSTALGMSVSTLRRRLEEEGTTFTTLVDEMRRDLAERHLLDPHRTINEIAFLLGFAHAPAFHKAFRRWTGVTPSECRARMWT